MWDARTEPEIVKRFEELWGTKELLVSFDTFNITLPGRKDNDFTPWPHTDQAPERKGLACVQGLLNLSPAGPKDGGLLLMVGSSSLFEEFFRCNPARDRGNVAAKFYDFYGFNEDEIKWFEEKGCRQIKVNAEPGDLILWDSRTIHHVALPESETIRTVLYTCFTPAALAKPEDVTYKAELFGRWEATTHWPHCNVWGHGKAMVDGKIDPMERDKPLEKPELTEQVLKLAGVKPY
ncbi:hypothetical protein MRS44_005597 [Fusarium solani]|uniref:uncharacterized protein n=1 Tax=Fusarium solani TaxID=169388 RepID=UPI0032C46CC2|nr:hypothetical protein MRS44_005597 [Fusarium solani]